MATPLDPKQTVSFEELLMSQVVQQESPHKTACGKRAIHQEGVLEMVRVVDGEMKRIEK